MTQAACAAVALTLLVGAAPNAPGSASSRALPALAARLAESTRGQLTEGPLALYVASSSPELSRAFATLLSAELAKWGPFAVEAPTAAAAEQVARAKGAASLLRLTLSVEQGQLRAQGDLLGTWVNFWAGRVPSRPPAPAAVLSQQLPADPEVLGLTALGGSAAAVGPARLVGAVLVHLRSRPAALAAGDLTGDGRPELVVLTDDAVLAFSADGKPLAERDLRTLPLAASPCREPFGSLAIEGGQLLYFSARTGRGEVLALAGSAFTVVSAMEDAPLSDTRPGRRAKWVAGTNSFAPAFGAPRPFSTFSARSSARLLVMTDATAILVPALEGAPVQVEGVGQGSALADLEGDGQLELVTTSPSYLPDPDMLEVRGWPVAGPLMVQQPRLRVPLLSGSALMVVAVDVDQDGADELVVGAWLPGGDGELELFRSAR